MNPDEEQQLIRERERASKARPMLENPVWSETWEFMEGNLRAHMEAPESDEGTVLEARRMLIAVRRARKHVESIYTTGRMAQISLDSLQGDGNG